MFEKGYIDIKWLAFQLMVVFFVGCASFVFAARSFSSQLDSKDIEPKLPKKEFSQSVQRLGVLEDILMRSSEKEYQEGEYMCGHFSYDLMNALEDNDIKSRMMIGRKHDSDDIHAWISIDIDPQSGQIEKNTIDDAYELIDVCNISSNNTMLDCIAGNTIDENYYLDRVAASSQENVFPIE